MQTSQVKTCKNCQQLTVLIEKLDKKLWELAEISWNNKKYNLGIPEDAGLVSDLLNYKRILSKRLICSDYPAGKYTFQDIAKKLTGKIISSKKCLCSSIPPTSSSTTTTTTTIS